MFASKFFYNISSRCLAVFAHSPALVNKSNMVSQFSSLTQRSLLPVTSRIAEQFRRNSLLESGTFNIQPVRTVTKFSATKGKRRTVHSVVRRFYRLHWGIWIRTLAGRQKKLWKKSKTNRRTLKHHVFTNATQSYLLDKMVCNFWRRPKYYIEDPYAPYHTREYFRITKTKPWRPEGVDYE